MIAVDTNLLVCAHREDPPWHDAARRLETLELAEGLRAWATPLALPPPILPSSRIEIHAVSTPLEVDWSRWLARPGISQPGPAGRNQREMAGVAAYLRWDESRPTLMNAAS